MQLDIFALWLTKYFYLSKYIIAAIIYVKLVMFYLSIYFLFVLFICFFLNFCSILDKNTQFCLCKYIIDAVNYVMGYFCSTWQKSFYLCKCIITAVIYVQFVIFALFGKIFLIYASASFIAIIAAVNFIQSVILLALFDIKKLKKNIKRIWNII